VAAAVPGVVPRTLRPVHCQATKRVCYRRARMDAVERVSATAVLATSQNDSIALSR
jgi:hypothetical protein